MSEAYLIEAAGEAAGVVIRERGGFRFFASAPPFHLIEQQLFRRASDAERAARGLLIAANDNPAGMSLTDPLALPPDWQLPETQPGDLLSLSFLPFDR